MRRDSQENNRKQEADKQRQEILQKNYIDPKIAETNQSVSLSGNQPGVLRPGQRPRPPVGVGAELGTQSQVGASQSSIAPSIGFSDNRIRAPVDHGVKAAGDRYPGLDPSRMSSKTNLVGVENQSERIYVPPSTQIDETKESRDIDAIPNVSNNGVGRRTNPLGELEGTGNSYAATSSNRQPNAAGPSGRGGLSNQSKVKDPFASLDSYDPLSQASKRQNQELSRKSDVSGAVGSTS